MPAARGPLCQLPDPAQPVLRRVLAVAGGGVKDRLQAVILEGVGSRLRQQQQVVEGAGALPQLFPEPPVRLVVIVVAGKHGYAVALKSGEGPQRLKDRLPGDPGAVEKVPGNNEELAAFPVGRLHQPLQDLQAGLHQPPPQRLGVAAAVKSHPQVQVAGMQYFKGQCSHLPAASPV